MAVQTIGHDKVNQLRHVRFFGDNEGMEAHMKKHADLIRPKFEALISIMEEDLGGLDIAEWTNPKGGYFIGFDSMPGCFLMEATFAVEDASAAIPEPGKTTLDVDTNSYTISGFPAFSHSSRMFKICAGSPLYR